MFYWFIIITESEIFKLKLKTHNYGSPSLQANSLVFFSFKFTLGDFRPINKLTRSLFKVISDYCFNSNQLITDQTRLQCSNVINTHTGKSYWSQDRQIIEYFVRKFD